MTPDDLTVPGPSIFSKEQLTTLLKETIPADVPEDAKYVVVGGVDRQGVKIVAAYTFHKNAFGEAKFMGAYRHDWSGQDTVGAQVLWYGK